METCISSTSPILSQIAHDGFAVIGEVFQPSEIEPIQTELSRALSSPKAAVIQREGIVVGARNLLQVWPGLADIGRSQPLLALLTEVLGLQVGLVRALYFDKPPAQTWCLPWHKDLTIAVRDNRRPTSAFRNPTVKAGLPHVEAPRALLESMLTARIHLDDITDANGPMTVIPGSHLTGKAMDMMKRAPGGLSAAVATYCSFGRWWPTTAFAATRATRTTGVSCILSSPLIANCRTAISGSISFPPWTRTSALNSWGAHARVHRNYRRRRLRMGPDERAIREVHATWIDAVNAGDLVRLLRLMADDVVFLNPGQAPVGRDGFSPNFSAAHQQARINCISELEDVAVVGEVAYTLSRDSLSVTPRAGGEAMQLAGHRITVYRKQPDGRWLLARDAQTLSPVTKPR
ncbi:MAG: SgcJ/EcaC family oxidoreductase [Gemmataceae bacterium]